jgi:hypothetical protein
MKGTSPMASLSKKGRQWYVRLRDETGRQRSVKAGPDKSVAQTIKRDLEGKLVRIKAGTLDPREAASIDAERVPIVQHVEDYVRFLASKGCVAGHVKEVHRRLEWLIEETKVTRLSQLQPAIVTDALKQLKDSGLADRTCAHAATTI